MKTNPGGQIDPENVIGRDKLILEIWEALEQQSVIVTAERRFGKTTIMKKMENEPPEGWIPVFQDLEQFTSAPEFAMSVYRGVQQHLSNNRKNANRVVNLLRNLGGAEIGGFFTLPRMDRAPWQDILVTAIEDLIIEQPKGNHLLFLWDEMPYMLARIRDQEGEETAMQVLNVLRSLRQTHKGFRMLMAGSIGLHHVLTSFTIKASANAAVNDMYSIDLPPLEPVYAEELSVTLIQGERIIVANEKNLVQEIAQISDGFAFYIHHIIREIKRRGQIEPNDVAHIVEEQLTDTSDPWELRHYEDRLANYYGSDTQIVRLILDELATHEKPIKARALLTHLQMVKNYDDLENLRGLLTKLAQDHYLIRGPEGYSFRFSIIKRWWKLERELGEGDSE